MSETPISLDPKTERSNRRIAVLCVAFFAGMVGMAYASVPLYEIFCRVTGYGGTTQRTDQYATKVLDRKMTVRFDTNVAPGLPWNFKPVAREVTMKVGETVQSDFVVSNPFDTPTRGVAQFNVTPESAGVYFNKVQCFCFNETDLKPGETRNMPVIFYIDPAIADVADLNGVTTITLSYTYFPAVEDDSVANAAETNNDTDTKIGG